MSLADAMIEARFIGVSPSLMSVSCGYPLTTRVLNIFGECASFLVSYALRIISFSSLSLSFPPQFSAFSLCRTEHDLLNPFSLKNKVTWFPAHLRIYSKSSSVLSRELFCFFSEPCWVLRLFLFLTGRRGCFLLFSAVAEQENSCSFSLKIVHPIFPPDPSFR